MIKLQQAGVSFRQPQKKLFKVQPGGLFFVL